MAQDSLYVLWGKRNPQWEIRYEEKIFRQFTDYGRGASSMQTARAKLFGGGYEMFIVAFFIGLYFDERKKLNADAKKRKVFGQPIQYWGNLDSVKGRKAYPTLREYIFVSLVARTDFDFIALDKGEITADKAVDALITTMEEYTNWGLHYISEKLEDNPGYYWGNEAFLDEFLQFDVPKQEDNETEPESLD